MIADVETVIREYLPSVIHMSLATCVEGKPWVCELHYVFDDDLNLYFMSKTSRRHSKEIHQNASVAGNIVKQHVIGQKPRGVYFEGTASLLDDVDEEHVAYKMYAQRFGAGKAVIEEAKKEDGHKFYKIVVSKFFVFDGIESSPSKKYELVWKGDGNT